MTRSISITRADDGEPHVVIRLPLADAHSLLVALEPVIAGSTVSLGTQRIRNDLKRGLSAVIHGKRP